MTLRHSLKVREQVQRPWGGQMCDVLVGTGGEVRRQSEQGRVRGDEVGFWQSQGTLIFSARL